MVDNDKSQFKNAMHKILLVILIIVIISGGIHMLALESILQGCSDTVSFLIEEQYTEITSSCFATAQNICDDKDKDLYSITRTRSSIYDIVCINRYVEVRGADDSLFSGMYIYEVEMVC